MPSITAAGAFLTLFDPANWPKPILEEQEDSNTTDEEEDEPPSKEDFGPFSWPAWQARTGIMQPIFSRVPGPGTPHAWASEEDNAAVWSFVTKFWSIPKIQKVSFVRRATNDNNSMGRILFLDWLKDVYPKWSVNHVILSSLFECGVDPYSAARLLNCPSKVRHPPLF